MKTIDLTKAQEQIDKVVDFYNNHKEAFDYMNLKLYDAFYHYKWEKDFPLTYAKYGEDAFYDFCDRLYDDFTEDLKENCDIDYKSMQHFIHSSSSFYLYDHREYGDFKEDFDFVNTMLHTRPAYNNYYYGLYDRFKLDGECVLSLRLPDEGATEMAWLKYNLEYLENNFYDDVVCFAKDIITVYEHIKSIKENQVELFTNYLEEQEEELKWELEQEIEAAQKDVEQLEAIKEDYGISDEDFEKLMNKADSYNSLDSLVKTAEETKNNQEKSDKVPDKDNLEK